MKRYAFLLILIVSLLAWLAPRHEQPAQIPIAESESRPQSESTPETKLIPLNVPAKTASEPSSDPKTDSKSNPTVATNIAGIPLTEKGADQEIHYSTRGLEKSVFWKTPSSEEYLSAFPANDTIPEQADEAGYISEPSENIPAFLNSKVTLKSDEALVLSRQRHSSRFFASTMGTGFNGTIETITGSKLADGSRRGGVFSFAIKFSPSERESDQLFAQDMNAVIRGDEQTLFDMRKLNSAQGYWRYDLDKMGINLPSLACPWANGFDQDRKQFFFLSQSRELVANVYCKKNSAKEWIRIATLTARISE